MLEEEAHVERTALYTPLHQRPLCVLLVENRIGRKGYRLEHKETLLFLISCTSYRAGKRGRKIPSSVSTDLHRRKTTRTLAAYARLKQDFHLNQALKRPAPSVMLDPGRRKTMPRSTQIEARRNMNSKVVARKHGDSELSIDEAYEEYKSDLALEREIRLIVRSRRDVVAGVRWVSTNGLCAFIGKAVSEFEERVGNPVFPYNFGPNPRRKDRKLGKAEANAEIEKYARLGGWIRAAAKLPGVRRVLQKGMCRNGMNSPYTVVTPYELAEQYPSPGALERKLWAVKERASAILSAYGGDIKPSWVNIARALGHESRIGKAAVIAVAFQLGFAAERKAVYREARNWLAQHRSAAYPMVDMTDGVVLRLEATPTLTKLGVEVFRGLATTETIGRRQTVAPCRKVVFFVRKGERSYHVETRWWCGTPEAAIREAIRAWRQQDAMRIEEAKRAVTMRERHALLASFLDGSELGFSPLISRHDSYAAGNCSMGTEQWVMEHGWRAKAFLPGPCLIAYLEDERVRRVVNAARMRRLDEVQAIAA